MKATIKSVVKKWTPGHEIFEETAVFGFPTEITGGFGFEEDLWARDEGDQAANP